jgi:phosphatidylserine/phosphatidylglycerophosphate/cardiolipin synthase-like enzyme
VGAGWVHGEAPASALVPFAGDAAESLGAWLTGLEAAGFSAAQIERVLHAIIAGRERDKTLAPELVVSGPDVPGVPTADTYSVVQALFQEAENEIVLAGYAFFNGKLLFERLAERRAIRPGLRIVFHVDVPRRTGDTTSHDSLVLKYATEFREKHWPWKPVPEAYFDPRALETDGKVRASLHAKVVVVDRRKILLTSANFTEAAHQKNIELGVLCSVPYLAERVCAYFEALRNSGRLQRLPVA